MYGKQWRLQLQATRAWLLFHQNIQPTLHLSRPLSSLHSIIARTKKKAIIIAMRPKFGLYDGKCTISSKTEHKRSSNVSMSAQFTGSGALRSSSGKRKIQNKPWTFGSCGVAAAPRLLLSRRRKTIVPAMIQRTKMGFVSFLASARVGTWEDVGVTAAFSVPAMTGHQITWSRLIKQHRTELKRREIGMCLPFRTRSRSQAKGFTINLTRHALHLYLYGLICNMRQLAWLN